MSTSPDLDVMSSGLELRVGNKYRLGRKIGSGSFGDIYLGASPRVRRGRTGHRFARSVFLLMGGGVSRAGYLP